MAEPNSLLTRLRRQLAARIQPGPAAGEAWCVECSLNDGRTTVISADGAMNHAKQHASGVNIQIAWPVGPEINDRKE